MSRIDRPLVMRAVRRTTLVAVSLALTVGLISSKSGAHGRGGFTNGSLRGSYALVGVGGAHEAASVGVTRFDGAGSATRNLVLNEPDPSGDGRILLTIPATGTYEVNPDGTGTAEFLNELPDGSITPFTFDFVITEARPSPGRPHLGLALHMVQREAGIAAKLVTFDLTLLPS
jgi:hypothetical protein